MEVKNVYTNKDGRQRAYCIDENGVKHVVSYPRILMEKKLGRPLEPYEDVHHMNGDKFDNSLSNLELIVHGEHQRRHSQKYFDKIETCEVCGSKFLWMAKRQGMYYRDLKRGCNRIITCGKRCSGKYGRQEQLGRNS